MAKISTKALFDEYYSAEADKYMHKNRSLIDRPEVYEYEQEIGKQLVDMNIDELLGMILRFKGSSGFSTIYSTYSMVSTMYRKIFDYYSANYGPMVNPWFDKRMRGIDADKFLLSHNDPLTWDKVEDVIKKVHERNDPDRADYVECLIRLYHCGFMGPDEIVTLQGNMIDFDRHTVRLSGRRVQLDDRCFNLLMEVHSMGTMPSWHYESVMQPWRGGFFTFPIRPSFVATFDKRDLTSVSSILNRMISGLVRIDIGCDIGNRELFYLGMYEHVVKTLGEDYAIDVIMSTYDKKKTADLMAATRLYGLDSAKSKKLKWQLRAYIPQDHWGDNTGK